MNVSRPEPAPRPGSQDVTDLLIAFLRQRAEAGQQKYGRPLQTNNGRDALMDALQESLDLCQYLFQRVLELEAELEKGD
jgi:hypothetical protein